jgi:hypothetical protein
MRPTQILVASQERTQGARLRERKKMGLLAEDEDEDEHDRADEPEAAEHEPETGIREKGRRDEEPPTGIKRRRPRAEDDDLTD